MPALHGAIALVQVDHVAVLVAQDLHLDVFGVRDVLLQEHRRVAKGAAGFGLRLVQQAVPGPPPCGPPACRGRRRRTPP